MDERDKIRPLKPLPNLIFMSRWLQLPLYLGLIVAQGIYVWLFWQELYYLVLAAFGKRYVGQPGVLSRHGPRGFAVPGKIDNRQRVDHGRSDS